MEKGELVEMLGRDDPVFLEELFGRARLARREHCGAGIYLRGLVEFSNVCRKDCFYCGIRRSNARLSRFTMTEEEILGAALFADREGYASIVLQSGERADEEFVGFVEHVVGAVDRAVSGRLRITLSLGEQTGETYRRWFDAGARRYLLRIETSSETLYRRLHPAGHDYHRRLRCLHSLKRTGYQVGTGVMVGLPGQSRDDLAGDVLFFGSHDIDMIGMGPYIPHRDAPLEGEAPPLRQRYLLSLKMIALSRLHLGDVNIAATTALQVLGSRGWEEGIMAGANVVMPNITPAGYRDAYRLYDGKPAADDSAAAGRPSLERRMAAIGESVAYGRWGDSPHASKRLSRTGR